MSAPRRYTPEDMVAIADQLSAGLARVMPTGLAWVLIVTEPGNTGELRSNCLQRAGVAKMLPPDPILYSQGEEWTGKV